MALQKSLNEICYVQYTTMTEIHFYSVLKYTAKITSFKACIVGVVRE